MDEQRIVQIVRNEIDKTNNQSTYNSLSTTRHIHNGTDSLRISYTNLIDTPMGSSTYGGIVSSNAASNTLPTGWSASVDGTPLYTITHNLGTAKYAVAFTLSGLAAFAQIDVTRNANTFTVLFSNGGGYFAHAFTFILTKII